MHNIWNWRQHSFWVEHLFFKTSVYLLQVPVDIEFSRFAGNKLYHVQKKVKWIQRFVINWWHFIVDISYLCTLEFAVPLIGYKTHCLSQQWNMDVLNFKGALNLQYLFYKVGSICHLRWFSSSVLFDDINSVILWVVSYSWNVNCYALESHSLPSTLIYIKRKMMISTMLCFVWWNKSVCLIFLRNKEKHKGVYKYLSLKKWWNWRLNNKASNETTVSRTTLQLQS